VLRRAHFRPPAGDRAGVLSGSAAAAVEQQGKYVAARLEIPEAKLRLAPEAQRLAAICTRVEWMPRSLLGPPTRKEVVVTGTMVVEPVGLTGEVVEVRVICIPRACLAGRL